jgi:hypothetical protein
MSPTGELDGIIDTLVRKRCGEGRERPTDQGWCPRNEGRSCPFARSSNDSHKQRRYVGGNIVGSAADLKPEPRCYHNACQRSESDPSWPPRGEPSAPRLPTRRGTSVASGRRR